MNKIEALRAELKCREMVEGTNLKWWDVVLFNGGPCYQGLNFNGSYDDYEFALGVVEGKPVWKGDTLWHCNRKFIADETLPDYIQEMRNKNELSWKPPAPKTIMVELPIEYVEWCASHLNDSDIGEAFQKALESAKCK